MYKKIVLTARRCQFYCQLEEPSLRTKMLHDMDRTSFLHTYISYVIIF